MAMAMATPSRGDAVAAGGASHGLAALAQKLDHPLVRIRARALANLLFKLRERLVDVAAEPALAVDTLMRALVATLQEKELEVSALQVLQLLLLDTSAGDAATRKCAEALRRHGAAAAFQRGGLPRENASGEKQATYEALLQRLLATSSGVHEEERPSQPRAPSTSTPAAGARPLAMAPPVDENSQVSSAVRTAHATVSAAAARNSAKTDTPSDPLTSHGWRFPRVTLAAVDDQLLFEFEVKWRLRKSVEEIVEMCDTFRRELLRDFPAEVFLQRPAVMLRVLELVRQPIVPAVTTPELSFGVNYFDEPASRDSFVWKPSVLATALHVSTLKALESWLAALRHSMEISLNPMYHAFQSSPLDGLVIPTNGLDHRRLHYPCVSDEVDRDDEMGLSLSGAAYLIIATLMRLLGSDNYPHLHLLNLIHTTTALLPDRSLSRRENSLDKPRLEALFTIVMDVVRVKEMDLDALVKGSIVDWLVAVVQRLRPSAFQVEGRLPRQEESEIHARIEIPLILWNWLLQQLAADQTGSDDAMSGMIQLLNQIDSSASSTMRQFIESNEYSTHLTEAFASDSQPVTLQLALQVLRAVPSLSEHHRSRAVHIVLEAVCRELDQHLPQSREQVSNDIVNNVLTQTISFVHRDTPEYCRDFAVHFFDGLIAWMLEDSSRLTPSRRLKLVLTSVLASGEFLHLLLCSLVGCESTSTMEDVLWRLAELLLRALDQELEQSNGGSATLALSKSVAILQHLAYFDSSASAINETHRRLQRTLMHVAHQTEANLTVSSQLLFVSRCLLHRSAFVRRAAASGLVERLGLQQMLPNSLVGADPFGQFADGKGESERRVLEHELPSILQPRMSNSDRQGNDSAVSASSVLHRISRLRKLLSSLFTTTVPEENQSPMQSAATSTLQQLLIDLAHANPIDFTILEESGEVEELIHLALRLLPRREQTESTKFHSFRASSLSIVRILLTRSIGWRQLLREDTEWLGVLLPFVFDDEARVRAEMYFIIIALSCSLEVVTLTNAPLGLVVPSEFSTTFGLFSEKWSVSGISVHKIMDAMKQSATVSDDKLFITNDRSLPHSGASREALQRLLDSLAAAKSFRTFLDALYAVLHACHGRRDICTKMSAHWEETSCRRYLETPPTSGKDQVVMAAILSLINVLFGSMSTEQQMDILLLLRNKIIPLHLARARDLVKTTALPAELARLLLRISQSSMADMFVPLLVDTGLGENLGKLIVSSGVFGTKALSQQSLWMQVTLTALERSKAQHDDSPAHQQLLDSVRMPLEAICGRHRVPGSFQERDAQANAVSCLMMLQAADSDATWRTRLLFDTISNFRSAGYQVAALTLGIDDRDATTRILRLATDTMRDDTESDAVRSNAVEYLLEFHRRVEPDALPSYSAYVDGQKFVANLIRDLVVSTRAKTKCGVRLTLSRLQLLRFFSCHADRFADTSYGNALDHLANDCREDSRALMAIMELLSIRRAFELYQHHSARFLRMQSGENGVWRGSILPVVLNTVSEAAQLLQVVVHHFSSTSPNPVEVAPFVLQLIETISDISKSLDGSVHDRVDALKQYYDALDQCGKLMAIVLSSDAKVSLSCDIASRLLREIAALLNPAHPRLFRISFARVVPTVLCRLPGDHSTDSVMTTNLVSIGANLWAAYRELCEHQPMDPSVTHHRTDSFLPHLSRVTFALHVLLSRSKDASSSLCENRYEAVQRVSQAIKKSFAAIRMLGGFGGKSKGSDDSFQLELCQAIHLHCQVLSGLFVQSGRAQTLAREEQLPTVVANNWSILLSASRRKSGVLVSALRLLQNFIHSNEANKTSLATAVATVAPTRASSTASGDGERNLFGMIGELALGGSASLASDERCCSIASSILKSAFLHVDCLHSAIKTGLVTKIVSTVVNRSRRRRETSKVPSPQDERTLIELVGVLASVASSDEGRQVVLQVRELRGLLDDIFHFPESSKLMVAGALFVRNMAFSKFSKSYFSVWEPALDHILSLLYRWGGESSSSVGVNGDTPRSIAADHLSTALLCFIHDNQRAQSVMQASSKQMLLLGDATRAWGRMAGLKDVGRVAIISANLERVSKLVLSESEVHKENDDPSQTANR